ncbi:MAG: hypothetical protein N2444_10940 [Methylocystis sp.]|nr:hypothetical protein [Methylocystis sp.]
MTDHDAPGATLLEGVRITEEQSFLTRWRTQRRGQASFARLAEAPVERRADRRTTSRLRSGKALDCKDAFLCDCAIRNRTAGGACLQLSRNIAPPTQFLLFEDDSGDIYAARIVWRRGPLIGCRLSSAPLAGKTRVAQRMKSRYYTM